MNLLKLAIPIESPTFLLDNYDRIGDIVLVISISLNELGELFIHLVKDKKYLLRYKNRI